MNAHQPLRRFPAPVPPASEAFCRFEKPVRVLAEIRDDDVIALLRRLGSVPAEYPQFEERRAAWVKQVQERGK